MLSADGRTISGWFGCGGRLVARESAVQVTLTYIASAVQAGGLSCDMALLAAHLHMKLGGRALVDGVTHQRLIVVVEHQ